MSATGAMSAMRQYAWKRRLLGWKALPSAAVALIPSLLAFVFVQTALDEPQAPTPFRLYGEFLAPMCLYFVVPFVAMLTMLPILSELYERGAVGYLVTRPAPRWSTLLGLYQGGCLAMLPILVVGAVVPALILSPISQGIEARFWLQRVAGLSGVLVLGGAAYGAICLFLGVWSKKALIWAFGLLLGWGAVAGSITGPLRVTSLHRYLFALLRDWIDIQNAWTGFYVPDPDPPTVASSLVMLVLATALFLALGNWAIRRRDIL